MLLRVKSFLNSLQLELVLPLFMISSISFFPSLPYLFIFSATSLQIGHHGHVLLNPTHSFISVPYQQVAFLLLNGDLPTREQMSEFQGNVMAHTYIHTDLSNLIGNFRYDAHPMGNPSYIQLANLKPSYEDLTPLLVSHVSFSFLLFDD